MKTTGTNPTAQMEECRKQDSETTLSFPGLRALAAGAVGGVCSVSVGHPFDLVKGLYAGVSAPLLAVTPIYAVSFWGYDLGKLVIYMAGFLSAIPMNLVSTPFERVKILLQTQAIGHYEKGGVYTKKTTRRSHASGILRQLYREGGVRSMYRGLGLTFARDGPDSAAYFATYEYCKWKFSPTCQDGEESMSLMAVSAAGATAGIIMLIPLFPVDTMKSRMQSSQGKTSASAIARTLYHEGGLSAFYPGLTPALMRALPANAAATLGWELARHALRE